MLWHTTLAVLIGIFMSRYTLECESVIEIGDRFKNNIKYINLPQLNMSLNRPRGFNTRASDSAFDLIEKSTKANMASDNVWNADDFV